MQPNTHNGLGCSGYDSPWMTRRQWWSRFGMGLGGVALAELLGRDAQGAPASVNSDATQGLHHAPRAKRVIYLFQSGGPSQMDLFDYKPLLNSRHGQELPESIRKGQRLTAMSGNQASLPLAGSPFKFRRHGMSGSWLSDVLPHTAGVVDDVCLIKSMHTPAINHGPAVTFLQTGSQFPGRPSMGAWLNFGLGSESDELPAFVVLVTKDKGGQPLVSRLWGAGFLPSRFQGTRLRAGAERVLYLNNPAGVAASSRRAMLNALRQLHEQQLEATGEDPAIQTRIAQYELGFRMQQSIPEATDIADEPEYVLREYGPDAKKPGTFAANCLLARRLAERGVRFVQLYHPGWDQHGGLPNGIKRQCRETDQPTAALLRDLKRRGLLEDTIVVWGGEFGRTNYCQGKLTAGGFGRDHHPRCFTLWAAGGGFRAGYSHGATDEFGYNVANDAVSVHDFHATLLHLLGVDHERLTFKFQGRRFRLTDVEGEVVPALLG